MIVLVLMSSLTSCVKTLRVSSGCFDQKKIVLRKEEFEILQKNKDKLANLISQLNAENRSYDARCNKRF